MELVNDTPLPAALYRAQLFYRDLMMATVVVKASYEVAEDGRVALVDDPLPVQEGDAQTEFGVLESDVVPIKEGCDFAVYGPALSPDRPVTEMDVRIAVGDFVRTLRVVGDRVWQKSGRGLRPSEPAPFSVMPLEYSRAFGGHALHEGELTTPYPDNPGGRGYIVRADAAAGVALPNVEEVDQRVRTWEDRPLPAGLLPLPRESPQRGLRGIDVDVEAQTTRLRPPAFLWSHPRMHLPRYPAGESVEIAGMTREGRWRFGLPASELAIEVALGDRRLRLRLVPDTLGIVPAYRRFWVVYRRAFTYQFIPERIRAIRVEEVEQAAPEGTGLTIAGELAASRPVVVIRPADDPETAPIPFEMMREFYPLAGIIEALPLCASG